MQTITVLPGSGKDGTCEAFTSIELQRGKLYTMGSIWQASRREYLE